MKRFVSYLYSVYNNQKIHNAGFARMELRTGRNRVEIHLKENGYSGKTGTVYLFIRKQENIQGISIGNITFRNNQADFRYEQPDDRIGQTPWQIMQMHGILIMMDERAAFLSQWDEQPIDTEKFQIWNDQQGDRNTIENLQPNTEQQDSRQENPEQKKNGQQNSEQKERTQENPKQKERIQENLERKERTQESPERKERTQESPEYKKNQQETAEQTKGQGQNVNQVERQRQNTGKNKNRQDSNTKPMQNQNYQTTQSVQGRRYYKLHQSENQQYGETDLPAISKNAEMAAETQSAQSEGRKAAEQTLAKPTNTEAEQKIIESADTTGSSGTSEDPADLRTAELQPQKKNQWEQTWRYMLRTYPVLNQFTEQNQVLCVRIEIKDVRLLPAKYWSMVNNSFLLHGFFNYRYLAFGRIGQNWFVGIPGIYQNQEHVMASIFGFPDFLPQKQKTEQGEQPGYWYRILEI